MSSGYLRDARVPGRSYAPAADDSAAEAEAAAKARRHELSRRHLLEEGDFIVLCGTSGVREVRGSAK